MLALAVWVAGELVEGIHLSGWQSTLVVAAILGLLNLYLRPTLVLLSLPVTLVTFGLFLIIINAALLGLVDLIAEAFGIRFEVEDVGAALLGAIVISIVGVVLSRFIDPERMARDLTRRY